MRDVIKTGIVVIAVLFIMCFVFFIVGNAKYGIELLTTTKLDEKDPTVQILYERIKDSTDLRKAKLVSADLTSDELIRLVIDNITEDDYKIKKVEHEKIICQVTSTIKFTSSSDCKIRVIDNDVFMKYQKQYFNTENEILFDDFNYHGYECKNSGEKYYCMVSKYTNTVFGYSVFDSATKNNDVVTIREYYLQIDLKKTGRCINYFGEEYCNDYAGKDKPSLADKTIIEDGVLYEHVFVKKGESYYLESSSIVSEG